MWRTSYTIIYRHRRHESWQPAILQHSSATSSQFVCSVHVFSLSQKHVYQMRFMTGRYMNIAEHTHHLGGSVCWFEGRRVCKSKDPSKWRSVQGWEGYSRLLRLRLAPLTYGLDGWRIEDESRKYRLWGRLTSSLKPLSRSIVLLVSIESQWRVERRMAH